MSAMNKKLLIVMDLYYWWMICTMNFLYHHMIIHSIYAMCNL